MADLLDVDVPRRLEYQAIDDLVPDERNPKSHDLDELRASMGRWGYTQPIEVDERTGKMVAGHGRRELLLDDLAQGSAAPEGVVVADDGRWYVPVVRGWSSVDDDEAWAYIVAANRIGERAGWNLERLVPGLERLAERPEGLVGVGYRPAEIGDLLGQLRNESRQWPASNSDPDEVPEVPPTPVTKAGDVWLLGTHRLVCGDARDESVVDAALGGRDADLVFTSPPYNVGVGYDAHDDAQVPWPAYKAFLVAVAEASVARLAKGRAVCWNIGTSPKTFHARQTVMLEDDIGLTYLRTLVWQKVGVPVPLWFNTTSARRARAFTPNYTHEVVLVFAKGAELKRGGPIDFDDVLEHDVFRMQQTAATRDIPTDSSKDRTGVQSNLDRRSRKAHPAPFPMALPRAFVQHLADVDAVVLDPFVGAGTTILACHHAGRIGVGIDVSPAYVDVACERWQRHTGEVPVLEATGEAHSFVRQ